MPPRSDTSYIVFDTETVVDGALLSRVLYPQEGLEPEAAVARCLEEQEEAPQRRPFVPVSFHVPVAIAVARIGPDFLIRDMACLDAPRFDPQTMVKLFWRGVELYADSILVDFNGRGFDLPLLTLSAFRFGVSCPRYFDDPDRFGFRYRFTTKHLDLLEWLTEYGAFHLRGGLDLLAKILGKPGKMGTKGDQVQDLYARGEIQRINDYCLHDVLDTYFVFLRTRVLFGKLTLDEEQGLIAQTKSWLMKRADQSAAYQAYLERWGDWSNPWG